LLPELHCEYVAAISGLTGGLWQTKCNVGRARLHP
jgi:hypothetical protein